MKCKLYYYRGRESDCFTKCGQHFVENPVALSLRGLSGDFLALFNLSKSAGGFRGSAPNVGCKAEPYIITFIITYIYPFGYIFDKSLFKTLLFLM